MLELVLLYSLFLPSYLLLVVVFLEFGWRNIRGFGIAVGKHFSKNLNFFFCFEVICF
jgi:hypothetical protein